MRIEGRRLPAGQRASLKSAQLEVVLDLAGADALGELSASTRHGIWALRDEANGGARTHPLGFTAIAANAANCTVRLEEIAGDTTCTAARCALAAMAPSGGRGRKMPCCFSTRAR